MKRQPLTVKQLKRIFELKKEKVVEDRRRPHTEEFHNLYDSLNINMVVMEDAIGGAQHGRER